MNQRIIIINYGMGNHNFVKKKLACMGIDELISNLPADISRADKLIIPGVGSCSGMPGNIGHMKQAYREGYANGLAAGTFVYHGARDGILINYPDTIEIKGIFQ